MVQNRVGYGEKKQLGMYKIDECNFSVSIGYSGSVQEQDMSVTGVEPVICVN